MVDRVSVGGLLFALFLVFTNGFFVAAEFAFVRVRPTQVNALVEEDSSGARTVQEAVENLDGYLAVSQLGITSPRSGRGGSASPRSPR